MGYVNIGVGKIKTMQAFTNAYKHNKRLGFCDNADADSKGQNVELVAREETYAEYYDKTIANSAYYQDPHTPAIRRDAVRAIDICIRVGRNEMKDNPHFNVNVFCKLAKEWAIDRFGEDNIAGMTLHADEHSPHIHLVVIPITPDGRLCAADYIGSPQKLSALQDGIADAMAPLHLTRGEKGSVATHRTMKAFYAAIEGARVDSLPKPEEHENAEHYVVRANAAFNDFKSQQLHEMLALKRQVVEAQTMLRNARSGRDHDDFLRRIREMEQQLEAKERENKTVKETLQKEREERNVQDRDTQLALRQWNAIAYSVQQHLLPPDEEQSLLVSMKGAYEIGWQALKTDLLETRKNPDGEAADPRGEGDPHEK